MSQYSHLSNPDPEWLKVASLVPQTEIPTDFVQYRQKLSMSTSMSLVNRPFHIYLGLTVRERQLPVGERVITIRTYTPDTDRTLGEDLHSGYPVLVWMFGGGWCSGTIDNADNLLRSLSVNLRISCVAADYRKAPEHPFPTPLDDGYASLKWVVENARVISADVQRGLIVGGISTGGNLAAAMVQRAMNDPILKGKITGQVLIAPALLAPSAYPDKFKNELLSLEQNSNTGILSEELIRLFWETYHGPYASDPKVSPVLATSFEGLPRTYIQIDGMDPLRDEALLYDRLLREACVPTRVNLYPGFPHLFHDLFPDLLASHRQRRQLHDGIRWLLRCGRIG